MICQNWKVWRGSQFCWLFKPWFLASSVSHMLKKCQGLRNYGCIGLSNIFWALSFLLEHQATSQCFMMQRGARQLFLNTSGPFRWGLLFPGNWAMVSFIPMQKDFVLFLFGHGSLAAVRSLTISISTWGHEKAIFWLSAQQESRQ